MSAPQDRTEPPPAAHADHQRPVGVEAPGARVGPFKLLSRIGEGGFGEVWLAERREPMVQRVALKIIKPGMDSREVIARFEQERQALAVMDHPNVARVLDAGTTPAEMGSRPYFVMEYVRGEPITTFCDRHRLSIRQRLELFIPVCEAIQHAHHKGIIHRDIKPSNVLVTMVETAGFANPDQSDRPSSDTRGSLSGVVHGALVKVIDFGVAKAMTVSLTDKTIFTETGRMIGTPEYMSPEQAEMGARDVDTRTDIFSLGVLLYELLAGRLPFDSRQLRSAGRGELQRIIREVDPPRPSARLDAAADADAVANRRQTSPAALRRQLQRELEWIPLKAIRKERLRRYETAADLARDIQRYLDGQALQAGPESAAYRARKFLSRNRATVGVVALAAALVVLALPVTTYLWWRSARAEAEANHQRHEAERYLLNLDDWMSELENLETEARVGRTSTDLVAREMADVLRRAQWPADSLESLRRATDRFERVAATRQPAAAAFGFVLLGQAWLSAGDLSRAKALLDQAVELTIAAGDDALAAQAHERLADVHDLAGHPEAALDSCRAAIAARQRRWPPLAVGEAIDQTAAAVVAAGTIDIERHGADRKRLNRRDREQVNAPLCSLLAKRYERAGKWADALTLRREALTIESRVRGGDHPAVMVRLTQLAGTHQQIADRAGTRSAEQREAAAAYRLEADAMRARLIERRAELAGALDRLAALADRQAKPDEARQARADAAAIRAEIAR